MPIARTPKAILIQRAETLPKPLNQTLTYRVVHEGHDRKVPNLVH